VSLENVDETRDRQTGIRYDPIKMGPNSESSPVSQNPSVAEPTL
jgi:hypothetical protein